MFALSLSDCPILTVFPKARAPHMLGDMCGAVGGGGGGGGGSS